MVGGTGNDSLKGGSGSDNFRYGMGDGLDTIANSTNAGAAKDILDLTNGTDTVTGSELGESLYGFSGNGTCLGMDGDDVLVANCEKGQTNIRTM